jgi:hypothetical protein
MDQRGQSSPDIGAETRRLRRRRWKRAAIVAGALLGGSAAVVALLWFWIIPARVERALDEVRAARRGPAELPVTRSPSHRLDAPAPPGVSAYTATDDARDGVWAFGKLWVATGGGVLVFGQDGRHERTLTWLDGLGTADTTVMAR